MNFSSLKGKWHGLPIWVWALIAAVGLFAVYLILKRSGNSSANASGTGLLPTTTTGSGTGLDGSGGGGLGIPQSTAPGADTSVATEPPPSAGTNTPTDPTASTPTVTTTTVDPPAPTSPSKPVSTPSVGSKTAVANILVPANATATSLQAGVMKTGPSAVFVPGTPTRAAQLNHPAAVKVTANKTGASANKAQGVFAIH